MRKSGILNGRESTADFYDAPLRKNQGAPDALYPVDMKRDAFERTEEYCNKEDSNADDSDMSWLREDLEGEREDLFAGSEITPDEYAHDPFVKV